MHPLFLAPIPLSSYRLQSQDMEGMARVKHEIAVGLRAVLVDESDATTRCIALNG